MARGSIRKHGRDTGVSYEVVVDLGVDPVTGKRRQRSKSFKTKKEAQTALTQWLREIDTGAAVDRSRQTVAQMMAYWLETYARIHVNAWSYSCYERTIRVHITPALGAIPMQKLTPDMLQTFYADKLAAGCGTRTIELCHMRLKQALTQALRLGLVARNVADFVSPPPDRPKEMETWDLAQARQFLTVTDQSIHGPIWTLAVATGMRRGELLGLRWQDVAFERRVVHVRQAIGLTPHGGADTKPPKSKSSRREVPVPDAMISALREHKRCQNERRLALGEAWQDHDLVFPTSIGTPINPNSLKRDYDRLVTLAGLPRIRIHDQRHTHVTLAIQQGSNIKAVSKRVGHATTSITMDLYAHVLPEMHVEVADKMGAALFGTAPDGPEEAKKARP